MAETQTKYMHTIDGKPAMWSKEQIVFARHTGAVELVKSLDIIRRHQRWTEEYRLRNRFDHDPDRYGYVRVRVVDPPCATGEKE